jgi:hypothetical protein
MAAAHLIARLPGGAAVYRGLWRDDPYRPDNARLGLVLVHIPKTAGISVLNALGFGAEANHYCVAEYRMRNPALYRSCLTAAFVRNPYDRFLSAYRFLSHGGRSRRDAAFRRDLLAACPTLESFTARLRHSRAFRSAVLSYPHFIPQHAYIAPAGGIEVAFLGRYEQLEADTGRLRARLGLARAPLPRLNASAPTTGRTFDDACGRQFVQEVYARDFELLGYPAAPPETVG